MAKKGGENSKKAAGQARKAEQANKKKQEVFAAAEAEEAALWDQGAKGGNKKQQEAQFKKEEAARKKAERDALLQAEEASMPSKPKGKDRGAAKTASKRTGKIDDFLDFNKDIPELSASGIESALEALALTGREGGVANKDIDRHPERRVKAAFAAYEDKRLPELRKENPGLRLQQIKHLLFKEFQKSPENPMNQDTNVSYNASRDDVDAKKKEVRSLRESKFT
ncbi:uncharacterized protein SPAPADRAFT_60449 [Spathaspora passalidarum NRRL Y-27907]|uniref:DUF1014-domain-containing protein n=1 Tax=Spathaspora passalidarum (strain NRRL Y-27907 / 11-Y1) TaxID=619300 RepID=G3ALA0_SPAPN|nr:uncharacterized protein SPAPADRAFT_60449 [Spathaspora passalidarum NRRL Y-27907]EGW33143.1 hypothetical protein SPAPADRAFT_60449 [Spathaspora passalidarum NRRL Y-27907]